MSYVPHKSYGLGAGGAGSGGVNYSHQQQMHQQSQQQHYAQQQQHMAQQGGGEYGQGGGQDSQSQNGGGGTAQQGQQQGQQQQPSQQQEMTLPGILHFLQSEWRRWERERNEWEIERADLRSRIALLEGVKRSSENAKTDLNRRVKMLEYALKQERAKTLNNVPTTASGTTSAGSPVQRPTTTGVRKIPSNEDEKSAEAPAPPPGDTKQAESSSPTAGQAEGSLSRAAKAGPPDGLPSAGPATSTGAWKSSIPFAARDPKARARSREYLKQCLQEISYLTSPGALNPLPTRIPLSLSGPPSVEGGEGQSNGAPEERTAALGLRPKKVLPDEPIPSIFDKDKRKDQEMKSVAVQAPGEAEEAREARATDEQERQGGSRQSSGGQAAASDQSSSSPMVNGDHAAVPSVDDQQSQLLTAVYKPESKSAWKEALRDANEKAQQAQQQVENGVPPPSADIISGLSGISPTADQSDAQSEASSEASSKAPRIWKPARQLKSHLDSVHAVAFGPENTLISGSTDCTVKLWRLDISALVHGKPSSIATEHEPQLTYRGHTSAVTSIAVSSSKRRIYSASLDTVIRAWSLPPSSSSHETYSAYDPSLSLSTVVGHTDAIWDIAVIPSKADPEGYLVSASADGTVKVWDTTGADGNVSLFASWRYDTNEGGDNKPAEDAPVPIAIAVYPSDLKNVLIGYTNGVIKLFEVGTGQAVLDFLPTDEVEGSIHAVNTVACHPTLPVVIAGYDDGRIRFFDAKTGRMTDSLVGHAASVNSLAIDPTSSSVFASVGDDCSTRVWDLESKTCIQEWTLHRRKADQGVLGLAFRDLPGLSWDGGVMSTAGSDGTVRVYVKEK